MNDKYAQWLPQVDGKSIEAEDPSNLDQCFDLAFNWVDFLGIPRDTIRHLYAYQIYQSPNPNTSEHFDLIANTPDAIPQVGDLVVFDTTVGPDGHVCIASSVADLNTFISEDQNWGGKQYARQVTHNYNGCVGFLRPKIAIPTPEPTPTTPNISPDELAALQVLESHVLKSTDLNGQPFGNLEGYANALTQDAYYVWHNPPPVTPAPPIVTTVVTEPQFTSSLAKLFYQWAKQLG